MKNQSFPHSLLLLFFCISIGIQAQPFQRIDIPVKENGTELKTAWGGGLNSPQFSEVDLNGDGLMDLYIFDRVGDVSLTFLNDDIDDAVSYTFTPVHARNFPPVHDWVMLRDFDGDGVMDIFTESSVPGVFGIEVFKGYMNNGKIDFEKFKTFDGAYDILYFQQTNGSFTQINVSTEDYPAVDDIDGDGDLDIITFNIGGGYIEYFMNQSVEKGFGRDSLKFILADQCWMKLYESGISGCVNLSDSPDECADPLHGGIGGSARHAGSAILTFDNDNDGDKDLILGDISFTNLVFVENGGTPEKAWGTSQDCSFPSYDVPVDIPIFPSTFYLDVDNDGAKDILVAPNNKNNSQDVDNVWHYKNITGNAMPTFRLQRKNLFEQDMLDFGTGATPVFADVNADGLMDLVVGNETLYKTGGEKDSRLFLLLNKGTANAPEFELVDDDWLNFSDALGSNNYYLTPAFGDLDNDGDLDLLVGENSGKLFFVNNTAGAGNPMQFAAPQFGYMGIDIGQNSVPEIVDLDRDGLPDLVVGELNNNPVDPNDPETVVGNLNFFKNVGTVSSPLFDPDPDAAGNNKVLGQVLTFDVGFFTGNSAPRFIDFNGQYRLFAGATSGKIKVYTNIDGNLGGAFTKTHNDFGNINVGHEVRPTFADINNDGLLDMVVGNKRGGLSAFITNIKVDGSVPVNEIADAVPQIKLFPNPNRSGELWVIWESSKTMPCELQIFDALGRQIIERQMVTNRELVDIRALAQGLYFVRVADGDREVVSKLVVE